MDTLPERLRRALALRSKTVADLIRDTKLSKAAVYFILDGTTQPDKIRDATVNKLCRALGVSRDWLLQGKGPIEGAVGADDDNWADVLGYAQAVGLGAGTEAQEYAETHALKFKASSLRRKRLNPTKLAVYYGDGDSMQPRIQKGDAILFDTSDTRPADGCIFIVEWRGEVYAKRCEMLDGEPWWRSDNPTGDHAWNKPRRGNDPKAPVTVLGRVRWLGSWED